MREEMTGRVLISIFSFQPDPVSSHENESWLRLGNIDLSDVNLDEEEKANLFPSKKENYTKITETLLSLYLDCDKLIRGIVISFDKIHSNELVDYNIFDSQKTRIREMMNDVGSSILFLKCDKEIKDYYSKLLHDLIRVADSVIQAIEIFLSAMNEENAKGALGISELVTQKANAERIREELKKMIG